MAGRNDREAILVKLIGENRLEEALALCEDYLRDGPAPEIFFQKGRALSDLDRHEEALEAFEQAIARDKDNAIPWSAKGNALRDLGRHEQAIEACDQAIARDKDFAAPWHNKGAVLHDLGRHEEALEAFEQAIARDRNYALPWNGKGNALFGLGRHEEAIAAYEQAIARDDDYAAPRNGRGNALSALGWHIEAIEVFEQAIARDKDDALPWNGKGNAFHALGWHKEAIEAYEQAIARDRDYATPWNGKGNALNDLGRHEEAIAAYEQAIARDKDYAPPWNGKGNAHSYLGRHEQAIEAFEQAIARDKDYAPPWNGMGTALSELGRREQAIEAFEQAIARDKDEALPWNGKGISYLHLGRVPLSGRCLRRFCALAQARDIYDLHDNLRIAFSSLAPSPLLLKRLADERPLLLTDSRWLAAYRGALDDCRAELILCAFLDSPLSSLSVSEELRVKGLLNYLHGDAQAADQMFSSLASLDPGDLLAWHYLLQARSDYFEPADQAADQALLAARDVLARTRADAHDFYYAGLILTTLEHDAEALDAFGRAEKFLPPMYQRAMLLDDLAADQDLSPEAREAHAAKRDQCVRNCLEMERVNVRLGRPLLAGNPMARIEFMTDPAWPRRIMEFAHTHEIAGAASLLEEFFERHPEEDTGLASGEDPSTPWASTLEEAECGLRLASESLERFENDYAGLIREGLAQFRGHLLEAGLPVDRWATLAVHDLEEALAEVIERRAGEAAAENLLMNLVCYFMCAGRLPLPTGLLLRAYLAVRRGQDGEPAERFFLRASFGIAGGVVGYLVGNLSGALAGPVVAEGARSLFLYFQSRPKKPRNYNEFKTKFLEFVQHLDSSSNLWA